MRIKSYILGGILIRYFEEIPVCIFSVNLPIPETEDMIIRNKVLAKGLRITGTPTFIIGNQIIQGFINLDKMKQAVTIAREVGKNVAEKN